MLKKQIEFRDQFIEVQNYDNCTSTLYPCHQPSCTYQAVLCTDPVEKMICNTLQVILSPRVLKRETIQ